MNTCYILHVVQQHLENTIDLDMAMYLMGCSNPGYRYHTEQNSL